MTCTVTIIFDIICGTRCSPSTHLMIVRIYVRHIYIIINRKYYSLGLGPETVVCALCFTVFFWKYISLLLLLTTICTSAVIKGTFVNTTGVLFMGSVSMFNREFARNAAAGRTVWFLNSYALAGNLLDIVHNSLDGMWPSGHYWGCYNVDLRLKLRQLTQTGIAPK